MSEYLPKTNPNLSSNQFDIIYSDRYLFTDDDLVILDDPCFDDLGHGKYENV